ncbi:adenyl-nucleotide exchange factor SSE1 [Ascoidea rubescens DSM 1968]|uniref:Heat shock protein n=1 Tax=Ascoidea rubescens DSM 1968 TaxID=1344418 RepID=A0A1D2VN19_9ASCO|nr:heat shock protein [Ascoidea rubescens DSM 1968]ODV62989.1 heat shock protein [Ascoidea rubescens DSM 1968]
MSVPFGFDFGNNNSVIAVARNRGIDIVVNEVSNRSTPTLVGFGMKNRAIGESAKNQQNSNIKNTVGNLKRILGKNFTDNDVQIESKYFTSPLIDLNGKVGTKVRFLGKQTEFSATQLAAMYLNKIKQTTAKEVKGIIKDICVAVPVWYTEQQRRALADAAIIAGLNPVRIVNELTAAAVGYGVFKQNDLPEDKPKTVAFIDIGHSSYSVSIVAIKRGELKVLGSASDKHFGGRDFDIAITEHLADEFKSKHKFDIRTNPKAYNRVIQASEKLKKVLSANSEAPISIESLMNDVDVRSHLKREELESLVQPLLEKVPAPVLAACEAAGIKPTDVDTIEVIGGTTRVPAIKAKLIEIFGKKLSFTLNQDEAIARGAAFICAIHSPTLRVRPFKFEDYNPYSITYFWEEDQEDVDHMEVFGKGASYPSAKLITLYRSKDFQIGAKYTNVKELPKGTPEILAKWNIKGVELEEGAESISCRLKLRLDPSGLVSVDKAYTVVEKLVKEEVINPDAKEDDEPVFKEVKKLVKKNDLVITGEFLALPDQLRSELIEHENSMVMEDKLVADTEERKNALEEYIYDLRGKLEDIYAPFASQEEKDKLSDMLLKTEDWLYDEGYDTTKARYIAKYEELASIGNLIRGRYLAKQEEERQSSKSKQEAKRAQELAEKIAAERKSKNDNDGDVNMTEELD